MPELKIVNVVATADLRQRINLLEVSQLPHTIFDQEKYGGRVAYLKTPEMQGKVSIFNSGKLISVGTKSPEQAEQELDGTAKTLVSSKLVDPVVVTIKLRNIVALQDLDIKIDLEGLSFVTNGIYEPEQFPGLIIRHDDPKVTYLVFSSGTIVIAGSKNIVELKKAAEIIRDIVQLNED